MYQAPDSSGSAPGFPLVCGCFEGIFLLASLAFCRTRCLFILVHVYKHVYEHSYSSFLVAFFARIHTLGEIGFGAASPSGGVDFHFVAKA